MTKLWNFLWLKMKKLKQKNKDNFYSFFYIFYFEFMLTDLISSILVIDGNFIIESNPLFAYFIHSKLYVIFILLFILYHLLIFMTLYFIINHTEIKIIKILSLLCVLSISFIFFLNTINNLLLGVRFGLI